MCLFCANCTHRLVSAVAYLHSITNVKHDTNCQSPQFGRKDSKEHPLTGLVEGEAVEAIREAGARARAGGCAQALEEDRHRLVF